ncbi:tRNA methyltransferase [Skermanella stibiiresistens SB22]|uniref:tRNA (cytidine(34)-2'-O)-methyltransferase n=1 Tax=Skermanella stibiiresistens SB22 TaxID=1385369 RepID=W9H8V6_9PROT|nr:tRNA (cytidine(34)-2'-O)-methyltransferase [Skermanella stibiiresistens]EWY41151.1 tRNA methyltransferase [Skermanella stibiiresistens SB22]
MIFSDSDIKGVRLALYQPDIPQNTGTMMRMAACLGVPLDIIEPCGFILDDRRLRRAGMDYMDHLDVTRHASWEKYLSNRSGGETTGAAPGKIVLLTTRGSIPYLDFAFSPGDTLLMGSESSGVPDSVADAADARVRIPMRPGLRSLNVSLAAAMVLGEALRQTAGNGIALMASNRDTTGRAPD